MPYAGYRGYCYPDKSNGIPDADTQYVTKHNGIVNFANLQTPTELGTMFPFTQLSADLAPGTVMNFSYIVPNECNDMHCAPPWCVDSDNTGTVEQSWLIAQGDRFVGSVVNLITSSSMWETGNNAIIITFEEGNTASSQIATIVVTNHGPRGVTDSAKRPELAFRFEYPMQDSSRVFRQPFSHPITEELPVICPGAVDTCHPVMVRYSLTYGSHPMIGADFRRIALSLEGVEEYSHVGLPAFRVGGRKFASLASQAQGYGNLMLTLEQQAAFVDEAPEIFLPIPGGWGKMGHTHIRLAAASKDVLTGALQTAWKLRIEKNAKTSGKKRPLPARSGVTSKKRGK